MKNCNIKGFETVDFIDFKNAGRSETSKLYIDTTGQYILKEPIKFSENNILEREIFLLKFLNEKNIDWVPKLLGYSDKFILMNNCGETISNKNIPNDYLIQISKILKDLEELEIKHNDFFDITTGKIDILVKNNKLFIVDFGWATLKNQMNCGIETIYNGTNLCCMFEDKKIIEILDNLYDEKISNLEVCSRRDNKGPKVKFRKLL
jgi:predicted Ser/Thr protein kinase